MHLLSQLTIDTLFRASRNHLATAFQRSLLRKQQLEPLLIVAPGFSNQTFPVYERSIEMS